MRKGIEKHCKDKNILKLAFYEIRAAGELYYITSFLELR